MVYQHGSPFYDKERKLAALCTSVLTAASPIDRVYRRHPHLPGGVLAIRLCVEKISSTEGF